VSTKTLAGPTHGETVCRRNFLVEKGLLFTILENFEPWLAQTSGLIWWVDTQGMHDRHIWLVAYGPLTTLQWSLPQEYQLFNYLLARRAPLTPQTGSPRPSILSPSSPLKAKVLIL